MQVRMPAVSYLKAIDVYFALCMVFVACALLEYVFAHNFIRMAENAARKEAAMRNCDGRFCSIVEIVHGEYKSNQYRPRMSCVVQQTQFLRKTTTETSHR